MEQKWLAENDGIPGFLRLGYYPFVCRRLRIYRRLCYRTSNRPLLHKRTRQHATSLITGNLIKISISTETRRIGFLIFF